MKTLSIFPETIDFIGINLKNPAECRVFYLSLSLSKISYNLMIRENTIIFIV